MPAARPKLSLKSRQEFRREPVCPIGNHRHRETGKLPCETLVFDMPDEQRLQLPSVCFDHDVEMKWRAGTG